MTRRLLLARNISKHLSRSLLHVLVSSTRRPRPEEIREAIDLKPVPASSVENTATPYVAIIGDCEDEAQVGYPMRVRVAKCMASVCKQD
jgi:hypothetical protein